MKKIILFLLMGIMILSVSACSNTKKSDTTEIAGTLDEIMKQIYSDTKLEFPKTEITKVTSENAAYYLGVDDIKFDEAIASEPLMSAQAHSIVLLRVAKDADIEGIKDKIKKNADGRKWICVGVEDENIVVDNIGNLVILIMDDRSATIHETFRNLAK